MLRFAAGPPQLPDPPPASIEPVQAPPAIGEKPSTADPFAADSSDAAPARDTRTTTPPARACPCDPVDWRCWEANLEICHWEPPPATPRPSEPTPERVPSEADASENEERQTNPTDSKPSDPPLPPYRFHDWQRRGVLLGFSFGLAKCARAWCEDAKLGGGGGMEFGYRFGVLAPVFAVSGGGSGGDVGEPWASAGWDPARTNMHWLDIGVGGQVYPIRRGRFDPYVGARLGYTRYVQQVHYTGGDAEAAAEMNASRGGLRVVAGLDVHLRPVVSLGPRFEVTIPFAGRVCISGDVQMPVCRAVEDLRVANGLSSPADRADLPLQWSFSLFVRFVLPPPPTVAPPRSPAAAR